MPTPLADLRVLDLATVVAGPGCARYLADFGATVIKVERPGTGDTTRSMGYPDPADPAGTSLFWRYVGRGKACVVLDLKDPAGRDQLLRLVDGAHVLVENLRPGGLEKLGLGPDVLLERNAGLVVTRVTGFGQDGPYSHRPGFATLAEAMSGFAAINGEPEGGPLLPPIALTDEVAALAAAFATLAAVRTGVGQVVDVNLLETMLQLMGPLPAAYAATGDLQPRLGSGISYSVPRGTWQCADGRWVAVSTSAESVARRVLGSSASATTRSSSPSPAASPTVTASTPTSPTGSAPAPCPRCSTPSSGPKRRRPPSTTWPTSPPTPTSPPAAPSSSSTGSPCRAWSPTSRRRRASCAGPVPPSAPTRPSSTPTTPGRPRARPDDA